MKVRLNVLTDFVSLPPNFFRLSPWR